MNNIDIILIRPPRPQSDSSPLCSGDHRPPLGLGFLQSYILKFGFKAEIIDLWVDKHPYHVNDYWIDYIRQKSPRYVGIYSHSAGLKQVLSTIETVNAKTDAKIILGGPHYSLFPNEAPECVDHVVVGEGEIALADILSSAPASIPRIIKGTRISNLDSLPWPDYDSFVNIHYDFSVKMFEMPPKVFTMNTSRGCPFSCSFCSVRHVWGGTPRFFSADYIVEEIEHLIEKYGVSGIYFREDNFLLNRKRTERFCRLLIEKKININWACEARVDILSKYPDLLALMSKSGCSGLYIGVESGSQKVLDLMNKGIRVEQTVKVFDLCKKYGIKTYASIIYGYPGETNDDRQITKKFIQKIKPDRLGEAVFIGIPTSDTYQYMKENKLYCHEDEANFLYPFNYREICKEIYGDSANRYIP